MTTNQGHETLITAGHGYVPYDTAHRDSSSSPPTIGQPLSEADEFSSNRDERCPIVLVLDTSGSMAGSPIKQLNQALKQFHSELNEDPSVAQKVDIGVITFNNTVTWEEFVNASSFSPPALHANGGTIISFPLGVAIDMVTKRKDSYRLNGISHHRPWIVLITDGYPEHDTDRDIDQISRRLRDGEDQRQFSLFVITCNDANDKRTTDLLSQKIAPPNRPPKKTQEYNFSELFTWLSNSMAAVSQSSPDESIRIPDTSGWEII